MRLGQAKTWREKAGEEAKWRLWIEKILALETYFEICNKYDYFFRLNVLSIFYNEFNDSLLF